VKGFEKNYVICMKNSEDRETLDKLKTKILNSKDPRKVPEEHQRERQKQGEKRKRIIYEDLLRAICKERAY